MAEYTQVVVLCEDRQQEVFARTFLTECGIRPQRIRIKNNLRGAGSGKHFVIDSLPDEVTQLRRIQNQQNIALVVILDADVNTVAQTFDELERELTMKNLSPRETNENIGFFIPRRNIETWIYYLMGEEVNESDTYRHLSNESGCKTDVRRLARNRKISLSVGAPPSLITACDELSRIL